MITSGVEFGSDCPPEEYRTIDPMSLLRRWLPPADAAPALMALSTLGRDGYPRVRHVLLSDADDTAVYFHTDSRSSKVAELTELPRAGIAVAWPQSGRQVVADGTVRRPSEESLRESFSRRTRYLQLLAWCNDHEMSALSPDERHRRWAEFDAAHPVLGPPDTWTGFAIDIREITFWRGDPDGPSQRIRFARNDTSWTSEALPG
ncbi:Pyridoxamine 5'-phosphate oxidase [Gordonia westfalica]|uniref:Pyridoxamine 5'-phosphate oxidase n=2 Tax=Gordonia westfalica TaxID=158898 RepID=A0A1H2L230_9ACTN|nr:pyridoxamine 5'-phosphate oxidase family protein [Gordonia westfalica]SDU74815.1 Pyridoxamine 5'-phosphate oxidase [Gordonia westfalica]